MEYIGAESDEWWKGRVVWGEGYMKAEDGWGVWSCKPLVFAFEIPKKDRRVLMPFRTNITPDQIVGSPGVSDIYTPCGEACLRLELGIVREA
jgi:hypothetical protein